MNISYLQRALLQDAELQVNIQSDLPLVEKFLQLNMRLFQLLQHCLHVGHRAALWPETNAPARCNRKVPQQTTHTKCTKLKTNAPT